MTQDLNSKSKYISYVLRHHPEAAGLKLDSEGYVEITDLIAGSTKESLTGAEILQIVLEDKKGRYTITGSRIRANQGHSTAQVDLTFKKAVPPVKLWHGAKLEAVPSIMKEGLSAMSRHYVHLSADLETAKNVGGRNRKGFKILEIDAKAALADGVQFFISDNGVWLVEAMPAKYIKELA